MAAVRTKKPLAQVLHASFQCPLPPNLKDIRLGLTSPDNASPETKNNFSTWALALLHIMEQGVYIDADDRITDSSFKGFETVSFGIIVTPPIYALLTQFASIEDPTTKPENAPTSPRSLYMPFLVAISNDRNESRAVKMGSKG